MSDDVYDLNSMTIVGALSAEKQTPDYTFEAYNLRTHRIKAIRLKNRIIDLEPIMAIDSISVTPKTIFLRVEAYDKKKRAGMETLVLTNDI